MLCLCFAAALAQSTFDFDLVGPAKRVVPQIATITGQRLLTNAAAGGLVIYVHGKGLTPQRVLDDLARATGASWVEEKEGLVLSLNIPQIEREDVRWRMDWLTREANYRKKQFGEFKAMTPAEIEAAAEARMPAKTSKPATPQPAQPDARAARSILTPDFVPILARLAPGTRTMFIESPNALQQPLPASVASVLHEADVDAEAVERRFYDSHPEVPQSAIRMPKEPRRAFVLAVRLAGSDHLHLVFGVGTGPLGAVLHPGRLSLWAPTPSRFPKLPDAPVSYSDDLVSAASFISSPYGQTADATLTEKLADPVKTDPHELVTAPALNALSEATGKSIVACLPDDCLQSVPRAIVGRQRVGLLTRSLGLNGDLDGETLILSPIHRRAALTSQWNRANLAAFIRRAREEGGISISNIAVLLNGQPTTLQNQFAWPNLVTMACAPRPQDAFRFTQQPLGALLIAAMIPSEMQRAMDGVLPAVRFGPAAVQAVMRSGLYQTNEEPPWMNMLVMDPSVLLEAAGVHIGLTENPMFSVGNRLELAMGVLADMKKNRDSSVFNGDKIVPFTERAYGLTWNWPDAQGNWMSAINDPAEEHLPAGPPGPLSSLPPAWQEALRTGN